MSDDNKKTFTFVFAMEVDVLYTGNKSGLSPEEIATIVYREVEEERGKLQKAVRHHGSKLLNGEDSIGEPINKIAC